MNATKFFRDETTSIIIGIVALGIYCLFAALSYFSFPAADDFAYFDQVHRLGFWAAQREWYMQWSGRYTATAVMSILSKLPEAEHYYYVGPLSAITLSLVAIFVFFRWLAGHNLSLLTTWVCSLTFWAIYISGLPNVAQSLYWDMGIADYQVANVSLLMLLAVAARRELCEAANSFFATLRFLAAALITIIAVGSNELTTIAVLTILAALLILAVRFRRTSARFWLAILIIGTICTFISVLAPGNAVRAASLTSNGIIRPPAWVAAIIFIPWVMLRVIDWLANPALWASAVLLYFATRAQCHRLLYRGGHFQNRWLYLPATWGFLLFAMYGIGFLVNHYPLPDRAECVVYLVFLLGCYPTLIMLFHRVFKEVPLSTSVPIERGTQILLIISLVGSASVFEAVKDIYRGHRYQIEMSRRFEMIKNAVDMKQLSLVVPSVTSLPRTISVTELSTDASEVPNVQLSIYYGLNSIRLGDPGLASSNSK
jgi:hypothetical protein